MKKLLLSLLIGALILFGGEAISQPVSGRLSFEDGGAIIAYPWKVIHNCTQTVNADGTITLDCTAAGAGDITSVLDDITGAVATLYQAATAFSDADATPSVAGHSVFITANTGATTITDFHDPTDGQIIWVIVNDAFTIFDFTSSGLEGSSADYAASSGDLLNCVYSGVDTQWHCIITGGLGPLGASIESAEITNDTIVNADINTAAAIAWSKMAALTSAHILVGSAGNVATDVAVSGDATLANTGALTIAANAVALGTDTTGNYVATIADAGSATITVTGSGSETAAITLDVAAGGLTNAHFKISTDWGQIKVDGSGNVIIDSGVVTSDMITNNTITTADLAAILTFSDGDIVDLGGITHSTATDEGLVLPTWANVTPTSDKKFLAADGSALKLYNGGWVTIGATAAPTDASYVTLALDATLSAERVLTAGTGIDIVDLGANTTITIDFDSTEIGTTTWGSGSSVVWTFNASGGSDPTITFGNGTVAVVGTLSATAFSGDITGNVTGNTSGSAGTVIVVDSTDATSFIAMFDSAGTGTAQAVKTDAGLTYAADTGILTATGFAGPINGTIGAGTATTGAFTSITGTTVLSLGANPADQAAGINLSNATYIWAENSTPGTDISLIGADVSNVIQIGASGSSGLTITPATTITGALTANGNVIVGNADTDTITIQSMVIGGNSRAVQIAAALASPTYATTADDLYVAGNIETAGTIYATTGNFGLGTDGQRGIILTSNTALTPTADQIYFINDVLYFSQAGTQKTPMRLEDAQTATGVKTFQAGLYAGDTATNSGIRLYDGSTNYWTLIAPTGMSTNPTFKLPSAQGTINQYLYDTDGAGTLGWGAATATAAGSAGSIQYTSTGAGGALEGSAHFTYVVGATYADVVIGSEGTGRIGRLGLAYEGGASDYTATIQPNSAMAGDVTLTLPSNTSTLIGSGANTFTGAQTYSYVNPADVGVDVITLSGTLGIFNNSDTFRGIYLNYTNANHAGTANAVALIDVAAMTGDANSNFYGIRFGNFTGTTGAAGEVERAISIGTGFDHGVYTLSPLYVGDGTNGMTVSATGGVTFAGTATFTTASATSSVPWVVGAGTAANTAEGTAYWESDTDMLTIGDGATGISLDFTANTVITFPGASGTLQTTTGTPAGFIIASQAIGDLLTASSATAWSRLVDVAAGQPLLSGGVGVVPAYAGYTFAATPAQTYTFPTTNASLARTDAGQTFTGVQAFTAPTVATSITPNTAANATLGTNALPFTSIYIGAAATNNVYLDGTFTSAKHIVIPDSSGTLNVSATTTTPYQVYMGTTTAGAGVWSTATYPTTVTTAGTILMSTAANVVGALEDVAVGQPLLSGGVGVVPAYAGWAVSGTAAKTYTLPATTVDLVGHVNAAVTTNALMKFSGTTGNVSGSSTIIEDATDINAQALNLVTTGAISGAIKVITATTGLTIGTSPATVGTDRVVYGGAIFFTTTATVVLPAVSIGMSVCFYSQAAVVITVDPNANDGIRNATAARNADGHQITCDAVAGNYVCLLGDSADGWTVFGKAGTWTDE